MPDPNTAELLFDELMEYLLDWNIDHRLSTLMVDNCSVDDAMVGILLEKLELKDIDVTWKFVSRVSLCKYFKFNSERGIDGN